ncbi:MAG TPA: zf-HC2 domain-containing protein [Steroidobacteraceae bacterium]|nr:zf-HC2 domain-containing protein [Steroidobacteraceae bacterium]
MSPNSSTHRHTWDLIPWIVNGTAQSEERAAVQAHLAQCEECRAELQFQRGLRAAVRAQPADALAAGAAEEELGLRRLRARLECEPTEAPPPRHALSRATHSRWAVAWAAAAALEAVALGALGMALWSRAHVPIAPAQLPAYRTLSATQSAPAAATIRIVLEPRATLAQLQALLERTGLTVVAGPSPAGVWSLAPSNASGHAATAAALRSLRTDPAVRFAEPLDSAP